MARKVKWLHSGLTGAPQMQRALGAYTTILDAVLVTGFNIKTVTGATAASGLVTLPVGSGHGFTADSVVLVDGATGGYAALNAEFDVVSVSDTSVTIASTVTDGAVTGSLTIKFAPLGWEKLFTDTNRAAYRSKDITSSRAVLYVNHAARADLASVRGFASMTTIDSGTDQFPSAAQTTGRDVFWEAPDQNLRWSIIGDGKTFYVFMGRQGNRSASTDMLQFGYHFGDFDDWRPGSVFSCAISGLCYNTQWSNWGQTDLGFPFYRHNGDYGEYLMRDFTGGVVSVGCHATGGTVSASSDGYTGTGAGSISDVLCSRVDGGAVAFPALIVEHVGGARVIRGRYRGAYIPLTADTGIPESIIAPVMGNPAGKMLAMSRQESGYASANILIDLTGPW